ncbi:unannotated protein [freshwater metagenome]|uniref:Unannotated protein n=1 Tax=freshwater metagenome TaxID=449393 RepID=A0A6J7Q3H2_9ZZZZ
MLKRPAIAVMPTNTMAGMYTSPIDNAGRIFCQMVRLSPSERWMLCFAVVRTAAATPPRSPSYAR